LTVRPDDISSLLPRTPGWPRKSKTVRRPLPKQAAIGLNGLLNVPFGVAAEAVGFAGVDVPCALEAFHLVKDSIVPE
jgi:hypothetical protein